MPRDVKTPLAGAAACVGALALVVYAAYGVGPIERLDLRIYLHFESAPYPSLYPAGFLVHLGDLGPLLALTALVIGMGIHCRRPREVVAALAVIVGANLTTQLLKIALEHPRHSFGAGAQPYWAHLPSDNAFPSGHTTAVASVAVALLIVVPARHRLPAAVAGTLLTASMAISVVFLCWHYPSDAVGGALVAATWGFLAAAVLRAPLCRRGADGRAAAAIPGSPASSGDRERRRRSRRATMTS